jgi:hypothetical protein
LRLAGWKVLYPSVALVIVAMIDVQVWMERAAERSSIAPALFIVLGKK